MSSSAKLCTILNNSSGAATISTIEHLMAAFYISGVDNVSSRELTMIETTDHGWFICGFY